MAIHGNKFSLANFQQKSLFFTTSLLILIFGPHFTFKSAKKDHFLVSDIAMDWSDHAMWWPEKNIWLDNTRWTLDQYNITADAFLQFTPMHKTLRIQLPDLRYIDCSVDFRYVKSTS